MKRRKLRFWSLDRTSFRGAEVLWNITAPPRSYSAKVRAVIPSGINADDSTATKARFPVKDEPTRESFGTEITRAGEAHARACCAPRARNLFTGGDTIMRM